MWHMITDNIEAYRRAVADTAKAQTICKINPHSDNQQNYRDCFMEEQVRKDGLMSVIGLAVKEAAAEPPHNPFSINGDVNQPPVEPRSRLAQAMQDDPAVRVTQPNIRANASGDIGGVLHPGVHICNNSMQTPDSNTADTSPPPPKPTGKTT